MLYTTGYVLALMLLSNPQAAKGKQNRNHTEVCTGINPLLAVDVCKVRGA